MESVKSVIYQKYKFLGEYIEQLKIKDKRYLFMLMRNKENIDTNCFFPAYGFTAGEFAVWQILQESPVVKHKNETDTSDKIRNRKKEA